MHTEVSYAHNKILHLAQTKTVSQTEYTQGGYNEKLLRSLTLGWIIAIVEAVYFNKYKLRHKCT